MNALTLALPTLELRAAASGVIEGYASTWNGVDSYGDSIAQGAFSKSLAHTTPLMLWQHQQDSPVGRWTDLQEDSRGLHVRGQINLQTTKGKEAHSHLLERDINGLSIGFMLSPSGMEKRGDVRVLKEIELREISIVSMPADQNARVLQVKQDFTKPATVREFEKALQEIGFSRREAASISIKGFMQDDSSEISDALQRIRQTSQLF